MPPESISDAEWQVMNVVWDVQPLTAQEVIARLDGQASWCRPPSRPCSIAWSAKKS